METHEENIYESNHQNGYAVLDSKITQITPDTQQSYGGIVRERKNYQLYASGTTTIPGQYKEETEFCDCMCHDTPITFGEDCDCECICHDKFRKTPIQEVYVKKIIRHRHGQEEVIYEDYDTYMKKNPEQMAKFNETYKRISGEHEMQ